MSSQTSSSVPRLIWDILGLILTGDKLLGISSKGFGIDLVNEFENLKVLDLFLFKFP
jgi:hypothetical protein